MRLGEIAKLIEGRLNGPPDLNIERIASIEEAREGDITWISHPRYEKRINDTKASCIIVEEGTGLVNQAPTFTETAREFIPCIEVNNASLAIAKLLKEFYPESLPEEGISKQASVDKTAKIGKEARIEVFACVGRNTVIGDRAIIYPHSYIGNEVKIGEDARIYPNATILDNVVIGKRACVRSGAVIGSDGFAYTDVEGKHKRIPHRGGVILEDDVEIGALSTVDRAVVGNTIIKRGTKIDNLVHIAHNVVIGEDCIIVAQVGVSGSVRIGKNVIIAGQAGITDHVVIGDNAIIGGQAGVTKDIAPGVTVAGYPARPRGESNRAYSLLMRLPELFKRVKALEELVRKGF